jgi:hypothetical protein
MTTTKNAARRYNLNTATLATRAKIVGRTTTVTLWDSKRTGTVEKIVNGRAVVRFADGGWAYSGTTITVR